MKPDQKRKIEANEKKNFTTEQVKNWIREDLIKASMTISMVLGSETLLDQFAKEFHEKLKSPPVQEIQDAIEQQKHLTKVN